MRQKKKDSSSGKARTESFIPLSVVVPGFPDSEDPGQLLESIKKIDRPYEKEYEIIILTGSARSFIKSISRDGHIGHLIEKRIIKVKEVPGQMTLAEQIGEGVRQAAKDNLVILEAGMLNKEPDLNPVFRIEQGTIDQHRLLLPVYSDCPGKRRIIHRPLIILSRELALYMFSDLMESGHDYRFELFKKAGKIGFPGKEVSIAQPSPFTTRPEKTVGIFSKIKAETRFFIYWHVLLPVKEIKSKPHLSYPFLQDPSWLRLAFTSIAFFLFFIIPVMSYDSGISGDEQKFHYFHGQNVYNYFATGGKDTTAIHYNHSVLHLYGPAFDLSTVVVNRLFNVKKEYEVRHIMNGMAGWLALLFAGLLAMLIAGWRAGIITMVLLFLSPRFLGHAFNNPKDIPFAMAFVFTLYYIVKFLKGLPHPPVSTILLTAFGIGLAIGVRVGGILLVAYLFLFSGIYFVMTSRKGRLFEPVNMQRLGRLTRLLFIISITGYLIGIASWPYAHQAPLTNPFRALGIMIHYSTSIRQLFEGGIIWSNRAPWYYIPKYIGITIPVIVLAGVVLFFALLHKMKNGLNRLWLFIVAFTFVFPVLYIINKESNVYGGWRHTLFVYPSMVVAASIGFVTLYDLLRSKTLKYIAAGLLAGFSLLPLRHIIANHPHEYIYYNELAGGTNGALGKYEMDYYFHTLKAGSEWLIENRIKPHLDRITEPVKVASNSNIEYYFREYKDKVRPVYSRYYERSTNDWDYAIFANSYISPFQLRNGLWPAANTIHTIYVDKAPVCAVMERRNKLALQGNELVLKDKILEGIPYLEQAIEIEPHDEQALLVLGKAYIDTEQYRKAMKVIRQCLDVYPDYDKALNLIGIIFIDQERYAEATEMFLRIILINERYASAYHNMGLVHLRQNNIEMAIQWFKEATEVDRSFRPAHMALAEIYGQLGMYDEARYYYEKGITLK